MQIWPSLSEFTHLAKQATVIPVWGELMADLDTPVSAFQKIDDGATSFLLESVEGEEKVARYSFLGSRPRLLFAARQRAIEVTDYRRGGRPKVSRYDAPRDPLVELERMMRRFRVAQIPGLPRFYGGFVGYLGYNVVHFLERVPAHKRDTLEIPDLMLMLTESIVIFDHAQHKMLIVVNAFLDGQPPAEAYRRCVQQVQAIARQLTRPLPRARSQRSSRRGPVRGVASNLTKAQFTRIVGKAKEHIRAGDIIQVVLSQRFQRRVDCTPLDAYRALRSMNPSPYMYFLRFGRLSLVGSSPEMLVRCEDGVVQTRPIAGTRRRGQTPQEDEQLAQQLLRSPKERAEHLMLVDLGRNDLGRIAEIGSVTTPEVMTVEKYSHVMHLVTGVQAKLSRGKTAFDVLRAAFPAGTVTGAPKVRAMELIAELEQDDRGSYAGAIGYFSFSGNLDTCITIRTILIKDRQAYVQAGAGIVADSNPEREYQETINKAMGCLKAIDAAEAGLTRNSR